MENVSKLKAHTTPKGSDITDHIKQMKQMCEQYHHHMVQIEGNDGRVYDGILDGYDNDQLYLLVPMGEQEETAMRQYPYGAAGYGFGWGYPYGFGYGYPYWGYPYGFPRRFRRFGRFGFPFIGFRRLFFPFFF